MTEYLDRVQVQLQLTLQRLNSQLYSNWWALYSMRKDSFSCVDMTQLAE